MMSVLRVFREHAMLWTLTGKALALLVACNYFAFRTELFNEEFEQNNPATDPWNHQVVWSSPTVNWETFDKDNAPKAIKVEPWFSLVLLFRLPGESLPTTLVLQPSQPIRDKSPPSI